MRYALRTGYYAGMTVLFFSLVLFSFSTPARADNCGVFTSMGSCATTGQIEWDGTALTYKICNGSDWITMKGSGTLGSCAGTAASTKEYVSGAYRFCDGTNWIPFINNGTIASCSGTTTGTTEYDTSLKVFKYCNGTNWINITDYVAAKCAFKTSTTYNGNLGGVSGANSKCGTRASAGGLSGSYKAWIAAAAATQPSSTFTQSTTPYAMVDGTKVADNWTDLTDGSLDAALDINELGTTSGTTFAWTNVQTDGTVNTTTDCTDWTVSASGSGRVGSTGTTGSSWTAPASGTSCITSLSLYCFEQ